MTVSQLIEKLQTLPPDHTILVDKTVDPRLLFPADVMGEAIIVAMGVGYNLVQQNSGNGLWIGYEAWQHEWSGQHLEGIPCVYIGSGEVLKGPLWQTV